MDRSPHARHVLRSSRLVLIHRRSRTMAWLQLTVLAPIVLLGGVGALSTIPAVGVVLVLAAAGTVASSVGLLRTPPAERTATAGPTAAALAPFAGRRAFVRWDDGRTYAAVLIGIEQRHCAVVFADGRRAWVPLEVCTIG